MTARHLVVMFVLAAAGPAAAESHKVLVLQSEGRADAATRAKIDAAIVRLAVAVEPQASAGELTYADAATAVGCKPETVACMDEVLGMLAVDEIVITTVTPKPGGLGVAVRRVTKGGVSRGATMLLAPGASPDKLDGIAPLFGGSPVATAAPAAPVAKPFGPAPPAAPVAKPFGPAPPPEPSAAAVTTTPHAGGEPPVIPAPTAVKQEPPPAPVVTPRAAEPASAPAMDRSNTRRHRLEVAGMAGGAGMVVLGLVLWGAANGVQRDIDKAPTTTKQDLIDLKNLESKGDGYAGLGNLFAISGLVIGGVSTYFYVKDRRAGSATASARLRPAVLDHGAGLVLTIGGSP